MAKDANLSFWPACQPASQHSWGLQNCSHSTFDALLALLFWRAGLANPFLQEARRVDGKCARLKTEQKIAMRLRSGTIE